MIMVSVNIDVPDLEEGRRFYMQAFGLKKLAEPYPGVMLLGGANVTIALLQKAAGSKPSPHATDLRRYERHWTPVHIDFHVKDFKSALDLAIKAGAVNEQGFDHPDHGAAAFCTDPFGNGFCILEAGPEG